MTELNFKSACELAALIRKREVKPSEAVAHALGRVEALNGKLNAFCATRAEQAIAEARAMDERIARREECGSLAGVPIGVKDLEEVAGMATTFGSKAFRDNLAAEDAIEVARLRAAGAIVIGKTNTPEFGHSAFTRNLLFGLTRNPWNLERTPGGSSGGSAAAVASGMVPIATASDAGGSIRLPAAYTGCVGLKPSHGRIPAGPRMGMESFNGISSVGPIARTVADAALFLDVACGYHAADPDSLPHPGISYLATLERLPARLRVAFHPDFGHAVEREVLRAAENAAGAFRELGCAVEVIEGPVPETAGAWTVVRAAQLLAQLAGVLPQHRAPR
jgi:aspartyl-tRNA(Asn)/glutamyl-tRNA(Gln) amidotransferase subunit A